MSTASDRSESKRSPVRADPGIELRSWRQFLVLASTLHYGRAAERLHMTQPPLSQAIQALERRLGLALFERTRRSVALTPAGAALVEPVRTLLQHAQSLPARARDAAAGEAGRVRLAFVSTVGFGPLPAWLRVFRQRHPGVALELIEATSDVQLQAFERGEIDAGFVLHAPGMAPIPNPPSAPAIAPGASGSALRRPLQRLSLGVEPLVLALPRAPPWSPARRIDPRSLLAQPLVIFPRTAAPSLYDAVLAFYHRHGATPVIVQEATQMQTIVNLVSAGLGIAWVPRAVTHLQRQGVVYRALPTALATLPPESETSLLWSVDGAPSVQRFVEVVRELLVADGAVPDAPPAGRGA